MARRYYGLNRGQQAGSISEGSSTTGKALEIDFDLSKSFEHADIDVKIYQLINAIVKAIWPKGVAAELYHAWGLNRGQNEFDITDGAPVSATGTVTAASVAEADTVTVDGTVFTAQDLREKFTVACVADVAGSLNNTYFTFSKSGTNYYVWYNVNAAGTDPLLAGKTAVPVALATGATAAAVATATQVAVDALAGVTATVASVTVTVVIDAEGAVTDAAQGAVSTGFTITVTRQGAATPGTDKFTMSAGTNTLVGASLAAAINANATAAAKVTATAALGVVTLTAVLPGTSGNALTLATSNNTRLAKSGTTLANGAEAVSKDIRVQVSTVVPWSRADVIEGMKEIQRYIVPRNWPPA